MMPGPRWSSVGRVLACIHEALSLQHLTELGLVMWALNPNTRKVEARRSIFFFNVSCGCCHLVSVYFREFPSKAADIPRNSLLSVKGGIVFGNPTSLFLVEIYGLYFYRLSGGPLVSETLAGHGCNLLATHTFSPFWHLTFLCSTGLPRSPLGS